MTSNSQSTKSLGQVAFEAWALQLVHTYPPTTKHELLGTDSRHAWQAAAEAVAVKVLHEQPNIIIADHELHPVAKQAIMETTRKHNAVIEAAKRALTTLQGQAGTLEQRIYLAANDLAQSLSALQATEGRE